MISFVCGYSSLPTSLRLTSTVSHLQPHSSHNTAICSSVFEHHPGLHLGSVLIWSVFAGDPSHAIPRRPSSPHLNSGSLRRRHLFSPQPEAILFHASPSTSKPLSKSTGTSEFYVSHTPRQRLQTPAAPRAASFSHTAEAL
jgi:hypothetical protein